MFSKRRSSAVFLSPLFLLPSLWGIVALTSGVESVGWLLAVSNTKTYVLNASQAKEHRLTSDPVTFVTSIFPYEEEFVHPVCPLKTSNENEFEGWISHRLVRWIEEAWSGSVIRIREALLNFSSRVFDSFQAYEIQLQKHPLATKCITDALICGFGDVLAQTVVKTAVGVQAGPLDLHRAMTVATEGMFISGPLLHYAYDWMEHHLSTENTASAAQLWLMSLLQVAIDILVLDSICTVTLMVATAILQGRWGSILHELRTELIPAVNVSWLTSTSMAPLQFINFGYVPIQFRVLITNFQDVAWNAAVSYMAHRSRS